MSEKTKREVAEEILLDRFSEIRPLTPKEAGTIGRFKDGSFGMSLLGYSLYSNGRNPRGKSPGHPLGLIFENVEAIFSVGYFRKESDPEGSDGYLFITSPRGRGVIEKIDEFADMVLNDHDIPCKGIYVRFLKLDQYIRLLLRGFLPVKEAPWHPEAPEEDETYGNSIVKIDDLLSLTESGDVRIKSVPGLHGRSKKRIRAGYNRFGNFLKRNGLYFTLRKYTDKDRDDAERIIRNHFGMLERGGNAIGSTPEDYLNVTDPEIIRKRCISAYMGHLQGRPVSVFVGETLGPGRIGLYSTFTLRDHSSILPEIGMKQGFTAMPLYAYVQLFRILKLSGFREVHLGGSELPDLNAFKRYMGGRNDPTYWAVKLK